MHPPVAMLGDALTCAWCHRELIEHPGIIASKSVLEIGSGCGLCGIVAAKLGAAQVLLMYMSFCCCTGHFADTHVIWLMHMSTN